MIRIWEFLARLRGLFPGPGRKGEREFDDELRSHLELAIADNLRRGMAPEQAVRAARMSLGGVEQTKQAWREQRGLPWLANLARDSHYALRLAARKPGFALPAVLALALGIGANGAIFSVLDRALLRPLPYPNADRLVLFGMEIPAFDSRPFLFASSYASLRGEQTPFESMGSWRPGTGACDLTEPKPLRLDCARVESSFLATLGVSPVLGRNFTAAEDRPGGPKVCVISYALWQSRFGGSAAAIGRRLTLDGTPTTILGVLPRSFELPTLSQVDVVLPEALTAAELSRPLAGVVRAYARLKPGVSLVEARAQLEPSLESWRQDVPPTFRKATSLGLMTVREDQVGSLRLALWVLFGAALALLLLACANVANLFLARGATRERELAVRSALGAGRAVLAGMQLVESSLIGLGGGIAGAGLAYALLRIFAALTPAGIPRLSEAGINAPVLGYVLVVAVFAGLLGGLAPALGTPRAQALVSSRSAGPAHGWFGPALVAFQVCASLVLATGAGLLLDTLRNLESIPLGMETSHIVTAELTLGVQAYGRPGAAGAFFERLEAGLRALPGVSGVVASDSLPPTGGEHARLFSEIRVEGRAPFERGAGGVAGWRSVTPGYFHMLQIPILEGRGFAPGDGDPEVNVVVLNKTLAARLFPGSEPIGRHLQLPAPSGPWYAVVGVAGDVKNAGLTRCSDPEYYVVLKNAEGRTAAGAEGQTGTRHAFLLVASPLAAGPVERLVRAEIAALDPTLPAEVSTFDSRMDVLRVLPRFEAALISLFAGLGVLLAALGLYGVLSFQVASRTREIGVRMALGAMPRSVLVMMVWRGLRVSIAGLAAGLGFALLGAGLLRGLLYGVTARDPNVFAGAGLVLLVVTLGASALPARHASRIDPAAALRNE